MDHFPKDCPRRPSEISNQGTKKTLNYIGIVPSPNNSYFEIERVSVNVVTRGQSRQNVEKQVETKEKMLKQGTKRRMKSRNHSRGRKKAKEDPQGSKES